MARRYRLYPTEEQTEICEGHAGHARFVWNLALEQFNLWRPSGPRAPGPAERQRQLAHARRDTWLGEGSSSVQQQALRDFDQALRNWWAGSHRRPTWRKRGLHEGFCVRDVAVRKLNRRWVQLTIPKAGRVRLRLSRPLPNQCGMARVTLDRKGRWHVSFAAPQPPVERWQTGAIVGVDLGVVNTLATSDGRMLRAPVMRARERRRLEREQRRLARQRKGSTRRWKTKTRIAALHQTVSDRRRNWIEIHTTRLIRDHDLIAVEDLRVRNMVARPQAKPDPDQPLVFLPNGAAAKAGLNRSIHSQAWGLWLRRLADKAQASGIQILRVHPQNTSRSCHACGHIAAGNRESQAVFCCESCGYQAHADRNAAENILARALLAPTPGPGATGDSPVPAEARRLLPPAARTIRAAA